MNNLTELANKLVVLGVITKDSFHNELIQHTMYSLLSTNGHFVGIRYEAEDICKDARVMAAVMELVRNVDAVAWCRLMRHLCEEYSAKNMTLSVITTSVELLEELR